MWTVQAAKGQYGRLANVAHNLMCLLPAVIIASQDRSIPKRADKDQDFETDVVSVTRVRMDAKAVRRTADEDHIPQIDCVHR
ncbi:hypothetical protein BSZ21_34680 [Bradyrhizobium canariense]|nr:hypothetical protein BSZ21_34680 [Bradyrhizobium canariense]